MPVLVVPEQHVAGREPGRGELQFHRDARERARLVGLDVHEVRGPAARRAAAARHVALGLAADRGLHAREPLAEVTGVDLGFVGHARLSRRPPRSGSYADFVGKRRRNARTDMPVSRAGPSVCACRHSGAG